MNPLLSAAIAAVLLAVGCSHAPDGAGMADYAAAARLQQQGRIAEADARFVQLAASAPYSATLQFRAARADVRQGRPDRALDRLERLAAFGLGYSFAGDRDFAPLLGTARADAVLGAFSRALEPHGAITGSITYSTPAMIVEGVARHEGDGRIFAAIHAPPAIVVRHADGTERSGSFSDTAATLLGIDVDERRGRLWVCAELTSGLAAVLEVDAETLKPVSVHKFAADGPTMCNDVRAATGVYATDAEAGSLYRLADDGTMVEAAAGAFLFPNGLAIDEATGTVIVADQRGLSCLPPGGKARAMRHADSMTLAGIDGLVLVGGRVYGVQNTTQPMRIVTSAIDIEACRADGVAVLASALAETPDPTTGYVADGDFWFVADSGLGHAADVLAGRSPTIAPFRLVAVDLSLSQKTN